MLEEVSEEKEPFVYQRKTDEEIKEVAIGIKSGAVFTSNHVSDWDMLPKIFISLGFAAMSGSSIIKDMEDNNIVFIYEYMDQRGPRCINGLPQFFSCRMLNEEDYNRVTGMCKKLEEL